MRLSPSACNGQPYHITVCKGEKAKSVAQATQSFGLNGFSTDAPILLVVSEEKYVKTAAFGAKVKGNDYRSIDIGILSAYITAEATAQGLSSCILGWFDEGEIRKLCGVRGKVRIVITVGYAKADDVLRPKKRKALEKLTSTIE